MILATNANPDRIKHLKASNNSFAFEDFNGEVDKDFAKLYGC